MGMGIAGILYGLSPTIPIAIVLVMVSGFFNSPSAVARQTLLQRNTPREMRGRVFSALFVMRDVIFLLGMAGAGLADVIDIRVLIVLASLILVVVGAGRARRPGLGRPAAEWRRGLARLRRHRRHGRRGGSGRPRSPTSTAWSGGWRPSPGSPPRSGRRSSRTRRSARCPRARGSSTTATRRPSAYFILEGEATAGIPEEDGGYRGLSTMAAGDFFGEIAALTGSPRTADVVADVDRARCWRSRPTRCAAMMEVPEINKLLLSTLTERLLRSNQPDLPRLAGDRPGRAARPAHQGAGGGGAAQGLRRGDLSDRRAGRHGDPPGAGPARARPSRRSAARDGPHRVDADDDRA